MTPNEFITLRQAKEVDEGVAGTGSLSRRQVSRGIHKHY